MISTVPKCLVTLKRSTTWKTLLPSTPNISIPVQPLSILLPSHTQHLNQHYAVNILPNLSIFNYNLDANKVKLHSTISRTSFVCKVRPNRTHIRIYCTSNSRNPEHAANPELGAIQQSQPVPQGTNQPTSKPSLFRLYFQLSKARLGSMVVMSTIFGYLLAPGVIDPWILASTILGTSLTVASANSLNQYLEVEYDSQMKRTRNRPLPAGHMSMNHALTFGLVTGMVGTIILTTLVGPLSGGLACSNILLYTLVYTPMKRVHYINTAIGSLVGAIPPLIGWAARTGGLEAGAWVTFLILLLWQMPHFHALSWPLRHDYANAGYKMLCTVHPKKVARACLAYTTSMLALGPFAAFTGLVSWNFAIAGSIPTLAWIAICFKFWKSEANVDAKNAFKMSVYWLPIYLTTMCFFLNTEKSIDEYEEDVKSSPSHKAHLNPQFDMTSKSLHRP